MFFTEKPKKTGIYRATGSISNFQCRITIRKIHSLIDVPVLEGLNKKPNHDQENGSNEIRIIHWQEKIFSSYEKDYYRFKENCKSEHQKQYYQWLKSDSQNTNILFTYIDGDNYYPDDKDNKNQLTSSPPNSKFQSMYLMADLGHEVLLFSIYWSPEEQILMVYPDFNEINTNPFYHEMRESNLHMYHYALEKCSPTMSSAVKLPDAMVLQRFTTLLPAQNRKELFIMPKQLHRNLLVLLEIVEATDFKYDNVHVRYQFELPGGVKMMKNVALSGSTHSSSRQHNHWHFGHCHELFLVLPDSKEERQQNLQLYFEAISVDSWYRERYIGHCYLSIPLRSDRNETTLSFVQLNNSDVLYDRMEAFLVGNRRKVNLTSFYGQQHGKTLLNRYGNSTNTSGKLQIRYQMVHQHQPMILNEGLYSAARKAKNISLKELITSFNSARERLEEFIDLKYQ
ncbi:tectonic-like complex member Mks1 [Anopheles nili]|uniref:tectonic-like complex member Mks1 n=1 Tax=Anopheles nili TaxID=185578 RepID=UPI00237AE6CE|nr:tectonic-like complex member Mks1 [Anopheles nili]